MLSGRPIVPWVPSKAEVVEAVLRVLRPKQGDVFLDLGCGDGRIAVAVAREYGVYSICVELKEGLIERARRRADREGVSHLVEVVQSDLYEYVLKRVTILYMYLLTSANYTLREKLEEELKPGAIILSLDFPVPGWQPVCVLQLPCSWQRYLYVYVKGYSERPRRGGIDLEVLVEGRLAVEASASCSGGYVEYP